MSKGDAGKMQGAVNTQSDLLSQLRGNIGGQNQMFQNNYMSGVKQNMDDYGNIMGNYQNFLNPSSGQINTGGGMNNSIAGAESGYGDFSKTGGFSDGDIQNIRARAISPTRAVYANAQNNIDRQRSLQGGYSPNYTAATAKMSRDLSSGISDANTNANAGIAQMVQQGKLAGLGGLASTGLGEQSLSNQAAQAGTAAKLSAMGGMTNLYGSTPGLSNTFGNQLLGSSGQKIDVEGLQNKLTGQQFDKSKIPSDFSQGMGNFGSVLGGIGGMINPLSSLGGSKGGGTNPLGMKGYQ